MKNKEKFSKEILEIACSGDSIAVIKKSGRIVPCNGTICGICLFRDYDCEENTRKWAESEYIEKPVISKKDRAFLEYTRKKFKTIARDEDGAIYMFAGTAKKYELRGTFTYEGLSRNISDFFDIDFPMVKWEDDEPWLIEDLKKLEVVDDYE